MPPCLGSNSHAVPLQNLIDHDITHLMPACGKGFDVAVTNYSYFYPHIYSKVPHYLGAYRICFPLPDSLHYCALTLL